MGIETVVAGLSAVVGAIGTIMQAQAAGRAAASEREARDIQGAQTRIQAGESRRQRVREERIRRARILAVSENQGTAQSSGAIGAIGALGTNLGSLFAQSRGESRAAAGINRNLQRAADFTTQANTIGAWTSTIQQGFSGFSSIFDDPTIPGQR